MVEISKVKSAADVTAASVVAAKNTVVYEVDDDTIVENMHG